MTPQWLPPRLRRRAVGERVDEELAFHLAMRAEELEARGMTPGQARAEALRRMGDFERVRDTCRTLGEAKERDMQRAEWLSELVQDLRFGARQLARTRGLTVIATLTLALGIGATSAIFSVVDTVILRALPFDDPDRVVRLRAATEGGEGGEGGEGNVAAATFLDWRREARSFERVAASVGVGLTLTGGDLPALLQARRVSADWFAVFGVRPALGRAFLPDEETPGRDRVVVISDRAWRARFGADPGIIGRSVSLDGEPHAVVGVMPAAFDYLQDTDELWVPLALSPEERENRGAAYLQTVARLRPGVARAAAQSEMDGLQRRLAARYPEGVRAPGVSVASFADALTGDYRDRLLTLLGAVGFVLLIACANVANLLLARGAARGRELAVRAAMGAGRGRLVRQLLTESVLLAVLGGAAGAALAGLGARALVAIAPEGVPRLEQARVDARVLAFAMGLSLASSLLCGLLPALRASRLDLQEALRQGSRGNTAGRGGRDRVRGGLIVAETALALVLLTGAGLLTRSALLLQRVEPGFDPSGVITARILLPEAAYPDGARVVEAYRRILEEARRVPGVASAGLSLMVPMADDAANIRVTAEGRAWTEENRVGTGLRLASPGYFGTMRIPLVRGRDFTDDDGAAAPRVAIVNETLARRLWPGEDAVGRRISGVTGSPTDPQWATVVGVARDVRGLGLGAPPQPEAYYVPAQAPERIWPLLQRSLVLVARAAPAAGGAAGDGGTGDGATSERGAASLERPLRAAVARVDANLPLADARTMRQYLASSLATGRFTTLLLGALSAIGLVLSAVGIYGIVAWFVAQRVPEIGVRLALGATPGSVVRWVVGSGLRPVALGIVVGVLASVAGARVLRGFLYGVRPGDPATVAAVVALLAAAALLASLAPALRASRVDPAMVMRG